MYTTFDSKKSFQFQSKYHNRKLSVQSTDDQKSIEKSSPQSQDNSKIKYKTEMCKNFSENGFCRYGKKCRFAHGFNDLKKINDTKTNSYRTRKCQSFWVLGQCSYGSRCQFSHSQCKQNKDLLSICKNALCEEDGDGSCSRLFTILG